MAKASATAKTLPAGLKLSHTRNRAQVPMVLAFVDKEAGIYESRKGAVARAYDIDGLLKVIEEKKVLQSLTRVSRAPAPKAAAATKTAAKAKTAAVDSDLEPIE